MQDINVEIKDNEVVISTKENGIETETKAVTVSSNYTSGTFQITRQLPALRDEGMRKKHIREIQY